MRISGHPESRFLGYVHVQVASRVYALPVESRPLKLDDGTVLEAGFSAEGVNGFAILVDSEAPDAIVKQTIERASAEAARHISRRILN
jgi:hypothetical protein